MTLNIGVFLFINIVTFNIVGQVSSQNLGVLYAEGDNDTANSGMYCIMYNPQFHPLPGKLKQAARLPLSDLTPSVLCDAPEEPPPIAEKAAALDRGNCTFTEKARLVQEYGGKAAIVVSKTGLIEPGANQTSDYDTIKIIVAVVIDSDFTAIKGLGDSISIQMYAPSTPLMDYNLILIWILSVGTVIVGAYWSGRVKHQQLMKKRKKHGSGAPPGGVEAEPQEDEEPPTLDVSPKFIIVFVVLMCGMLVCLYFLYDYLVYAIIALFVIASSMALYSCLKIFLIRIPFIGSCRIPPNRIPLLKSEPEIRRIILGLFCLGVGVWWGVERNKQYAWVLQDLLGVVFCIHMMKTIRLPSLKACTILLTLLFIYDIFFVFVTPLFTKSGESVMVDVATGGQSRTGEMLPMVLKVPRFSTSGLTVCSLPYSLLGFGDILVPGLLVSYCYGFDLKVQSPKIYYIANVIAYGVGLVVTFVALALMKQGQPALLYLVPCTLLTTVVIGCCRGELKHMWLGELPSPKPEADANNGNDALHPAAYQSPPAAIPYQGDALPDVALPPPHLPPLDQSADMSSGVNNDNDQQKLILNK